MSYVQSTRLLSVTTPLGKDVLLLNGFAGQEAISRLFQFQLDCIAENAKQVPFDALLGQKITVEVTLPDKSKKYLNGICNRVAQGSRDATMTRYVLDIVPQFWLFSRNVRSRIFQHESVPDILKKVLAGLDVTYELQGTFQPRDYCSQYRESDFAFASRLMEEEGIYYFFKHSAGSHLMVVANSPGSHSDLPGKSKLIFESVGGGTREEDRVTIWEKAQELKSGKATLWDHCFELPKKHLDAMKPIQDSVQAGKSSHKLKVSANAKLELYDYPGAYAQRFDGIDKGGGERPADLQKIFEDNTRTTEIRMQEEAAASVLVHGASHVRHLVSGHKFTLERHFEGDGPWVLYQVEHVASESADVRSGRGAFQYQNHFSCFPPGLPFRPPRLTPRPVVRGTHTAFVVGPPGEEIFTDKYGRIKVQFQWDREGKNDSDSSCWIRVATPWAGQRWGAICIPRIGQEVVVDFLEGDPDQPIVIGSVYNAEQMPPYQLPANKTQSGIKSRSSLGGNAANFNEIRFEDKKGQELLTIHAEKNQSISVENDESHSVGNDRNKSINRDETVSVGRNRNEKVGKNETIAIAEDRTITIGKNETQTVGENETITIGKALALAVGKGVDISIGADSTVNVGGTSSTQIGKSGALTASKALSLTAGDQVQIQAGSAGIILKKDGTITIQGKDISLKASGKISIKASGDVTIKGSKISEN